MIEKIPHITVCVCTYKRPVFLNRLLEILVTQICNDLFSYSVVVVDNDSEKSAESVVSKIKGKTGIPVKYYHEVEKGFSQARNAAVRNATGDFIAFIDDDEFPEKTWLINLYRTITGSNASGVLGPVIPHFETPPPKWVVKSKLLDRDRFPTGTVLGAIDLRTGNVIFNRKVFDSTPMPFDVRFGKTGGEDSDFFKRMLNNKHTFIWCDEAPAFETVPEDRFTRAYFLRRALLRGITEAKPGADKQKRSSSTSFNNIIKSIAAVIIYWTLLPFLVVLWHHLFMRYLVKSFDHAGKLLALCGIEPVKGRNF
ncbi:MAG: glycosyltransferase family 2 protein [Bacteroidales bacterium]|nr:glycosyltransferase family 2 protein [Bacteroidales bacterium]